MNLNDIPRSSGTTFEQRRIALKKLAYEKKSTLLPGAANALAARIMEDIGFEALYLTGAGFTNTQLGQPDLGLVTATEIIDAATRIGDVSNLPLIVDMDTKLRACLDARRDENTLIIARTDARAVDGFEAALERAHRMAEEGVDMLFVEAPESIDEIRTISELETPQLINFVFGGRTPIMSAEDLKTYGFSFLLYANVALQASIKAMQDVLTSLYETGSLDQVEDRLATFSERQRVVGKPEIDEIAKRYEGS